MTTTRPLIILGAGRIARALLQQLLTRASYLHERYGLDLPIAAITSSRYLVAGRPFLTTAELSDIVAHGLTDGESDAGNASEQPWQAPRLAAIAQALVDHAIVLDLTAADGMASLLLAALDAGHDVVLANKKSLSDNYATFQRLTQHRSGRLSYEATVGAGLPVIQMIRGLVDAGDSLIDLTACLSGTLGYLCTELEDGRMLSDIVPEALERGFTEPDPREDLSGADVRRKALILARTMGIPLEADDVPEAPLIPLGEGSVAEWLDSLTHFDQTLAERTRLAHEQGNVLRYVARILPDRCDVGLREVPRVSAVGRLRGTDNIVSARTNFYDERPLVISGPGAGPEVTAAGVFSDILRMAGVV